MRVSVPSAIAGRCIALLRVQAVTFLLTGAPSLRIWYVFGSAFIRIYATMLTEWMLKVVPDADDADISVKLLQALVCGRYVVGVGRVVCVFGENSGRQGVTLL